jgi:hypothetical protein
MYLYWQRRHYGVNRDNLYSYSVYAAESMRKAGAKHPRRRILTYLGSVHPDRQDNGLTDLYGEWSTCRLRCDFWNGVEERLELAMANGRLTVEQRAQIVATLAESIPPPSDDHRDEYGLYQYHRRERVMPCETAPVCLPDHVQAATVARAGR